MSKPGPSANISARAFAFEAAMVASGQDRERFQQVLPAGYAPVDRDQLIEIELLPLAWAEFTTQVPASFRRQLNSAVDGSRLTYYERRRADFHRRSLRRKKSDIPRYWIKIARLNADHAQEFTRSFGITLVALSSRGYQREELSDYLAPIGAENMRRALDIRSALKGLPIADQICDSWRQSFLEIVGSARSDSLCRRLGRQFLAADIRSLDDSDIASLSLLCRSSLLDVLQRTNPLCDLGMPPKDVFESMADVALQPDSRRVQS